MRIRFGMLFAVTAAGSLALTACGGDTEGASQEEDEYVAVWINPLSGASASFGEASQGGIELALEDIEEAGGINGSELEILFEDNELQPEASITAYQRTIDNDPVTILTAGSSVVHALEPLAEQDEIMLANIGAQSPDLISPEMPLVYNFIPTSAAEAERLTERLIEDEGLTKVAVLSVDNDYGTDTSEAFIESFEGEGGSISAHEIHELGATDMRIQLTQIRASDAEALIYVSNVGEVGRSVAQADELGIDIPGFSFTYALSPDNFDIAGEAMDGLRGVAVSFVDESEAATDFAERYEEAYGTWPNVTAAVSYDATMILAEGLREVGNDRQGLIDYVADVEGYEGILGTTTMTEERQSDFPLQEFEIVDGEITTWEE